MVGPGDDLLIGGRTIHDNDAQALRKTLHKWMAAACYSPSARAPCEQMTDRHRDERLTALPSVRPAPGWSSFGD